MDPLGRLTCRSVNANSFQEQGEERWRSFEDTLDLLEENKALPENVARLPALFRQTCGDLSLAQSRMYGLTLCDRLNLLVIRGYQHLSRGLGGTWSRLGKGIWRDFPRLVRAEWRLLCVVMICFWIPFWAMFASSYADARWIHSVLDPSEMEMLDKGFGKTGGVEKLRDNFGSNFAMFAFYIRNNVGIDFQIFAGGMLAGVGTLFFVVFNGVGVGAAAGYVAQEGDPAKFLNWVSGHSVPEFAGLLLSGMAGLRLGMSLIRPGRYSRRHSLVEAAKKAVLLLYGAAAMTLLAAFIEGFWSPQSLPVEVKYGFGLMLAVLLGAYLAFAGRGRRDEA